MECCFLYLLKKSTKSTILRCSIRNKTHWCKATVLQKGGDFIRGVMAHEHAADPGIAKKTKVKAKVCYVCQTLQTKRIVGSCE